MEENDDLFMVEQVFKNIDDVLWKESGCSRSWSRSALWRLQSGICSGAKKKPRRLFAASNKGRVSGVNAINIMFYWRGCKHEY